jgi:pyridinium-3,5-biscarboxylic acid mononucleotide sulfurtransferase
VGVLVGPAGAEARRQAGKRDGERSALAEPSLAAREVKLLDILASLGSVVVGYSGGVDSVYLAAAASRALGADNVLAATGRSASYPDVQRDQAIECARGLGIRHVEIDTDELADPRYAANPVNRCYYCKTELWGRLRRLADETGFAHVLDGSNADDASDHRPGSQAAREHGVRSPLLEAGLSKREIRELSRRARLPTWDQPASPCLASRLPYGLAVTPDRLRAVERAEAAVRAVGLVEFRVRHHGDAARLETAPSELPTAVAEAAALADALAGAGFTEALLDVEGYRRGALNEGRADAMRGAGGGADAGAGMAVADQDASGAPGADADASAAALVQLRAPTGASLRRASALLREAGVGGEVRAVGHDLGVLVLAVPVARIAGVAALAAGLKACGFRYVAVPLGAARNPGA